MHFTAQRRGRLLPGESVGQASIFAWQRRANCMTDEQSNERPTPVEEVLLLRVFAAVVFSGIGLVVLALVTGSPL